MGSNGGATGVGSGTGGRASVPIGYVQPRSYILRANVHMDANSGESVVTIDRFVNGNWSEFCSEKKRGDICSIGDLEIGIDWVNRAVA